MKLLFVTESLGAGGAERVISNLTNYLVENNDIEIVINTNEVFYEINKKIKINYLCKSNIKFVKFCEKVLRVYNLRKIIKKVKPDVLVSFLPKPSYRSIIASFGLKHKLIISERNNPESEYDNIIKKALTFYLYKRVDGIVFQTLGQKKFFNKIKFKKNIIIPNSLKNEFISEQHLKKENTILNVGRLCSQKNQLLLIESFYEVYKKHPDYKLKIYGSGTLKQELMEKIEKLDLKKVVYIYPPIDKIKKEMLLSKIFVLSSNYEGLPNCLIEAMSCGTACISTNCPCGGPKELINDGINGMLFNVGQKEELIEKINYLIENEELRKSIENEAKKIKEKFNPFVINKKWESFILEVLEK